ncbi:MAG: nucleotide exchange factor GrpE [Alphaproteobacteria bacterium]|nr:nucleotide exchange factor GrpE [Alphaproteobacteria bacterium]OJV46327.1 MAG: nucleotide exchange factor GrpE [Alphaproteobacteria bacterium 43-37]
MEESKEKKIKNNANENESLATDMGEGQSIDINAESASQVEQLQHTLDQTRDQLLRALAEVENVNKRAQRDREETAKYALAQFAREVLVVGDNLHRALASIPMGMPQEDDTLKQLAEGVEMTARSLEQVLARFNVVAINPEGQRFEPDWHQAMMEVEHQTLPSGMVVNVFQVGYKIHDRLLRPAMVSVSKGQAHPTKVDIKA